MKQTYLPTKSDRQTDRKTDRPMDRQTDGQTDDTHWNWWNARPTRNIMKRWWVYQNTSK